MFYSKWCVFCVLFMLTNSSTANAAVVAWGDSLTAGTGGISWPTQFSYQYGRLILNQGVGGDTSTEVLTRFLTRPDLHSETTVIWAGGNNHSKPAVVLSDIEAMVSTLNTDSYLVVGLINGDYGGYEAVGGVGYDLITHINSELADIYGDHFLDIRSILVNSYDESSTEDVSDFNRDIVPTSLRSDNIHLNTEGYGIVARSIADSISAVPLPTSFILFTSAFACLGGMIYLVKMRPVCA